MKSLLYASVLLFPLLFFGCVISEHGLTWGSQDVIESGNRVSETRPLQAVSAVRFAMAGTLLIRFGDTPEIRLEADESMLPLIETTIRDGELIISMASGSWIRTKEKMRGTLTVPALEALRTSSSGDITVAAWRGDRLAVASSSSGDVELESIDATSIDLRSSSSGDIRIGRVSAKQLRANLSSSGDISISDGATGTQSVRISSSGDYDARGMRSGNADVRCSSSGDASIWVTHRLRASKSSSGDIRVKGNPVVE
ncbi:MAG: DUF2807 domain-containing protein [Bacteroidia bacterium]|nr:DUF2807 domain-containing protein [Bacteroidia bacterium]